MRFWLKACPRCITGDLREENDAYGAYLACVQCGHVLTPEQEAELVAGREAGGQPLKKVAA
jgi:hypothetical protein